MFGNYFDRRPDGYRQSIQMGMQAASRFSGRMVMADKKNTAFTTCTPADSM